MKYFDQSIREAVECSVVVSSLLIVIPLDLGAKMVSNKGSIRSNERSVLSELFYERETEYYGMTPYALLDRIGSMIVDRYFVTLNELHTSALPNSCPFLSENQIAAALTQWSLLVEGTIDKNFELFETYIMKNILSLPNDFPIDKFLCDQEQEDQEQEIKGAVDLDEQINQITKRLQSVPIAIIYTLIIYLFVGYFEE